MSESREGSPDWLREFQAPSRDVVSLSSASDSSPERPSQNEVKKEEEEEQKDDLIQIKNGDGEAKVNGSKKKSSQSETSSALLDDALDTQEDILAEGDTIKEKAEGHSVPQRLPLVFPDKVQRTKALVECDGDSIDLSGDMGAVGRLVISNSDDLLLDLKGTIYKTAIIPSRTFCIVSVGQTEAKIEAIMNDFIQLEPQSNVFESETMVEGTLDGFLFDSDDETDKTAGPSNQQNDKNENGDKSNARKNKRKNEKPSGGAQKKAKKTVRAPKKAPRKTQAAKGTKKSSK
ncbi:hypothetical protein LUZ60_001639 [Juncus effusus]|nr:hypothetical protein LUZ60_001639 [Juncus effusus]